MYLRGPFLPGPVDSALRPKLFGRTMRLLDV